MLGGNGLLLPLPQSLYPVSLLPVGQLAPSGNEVTLAPGEALPIPAGLWNVLVGGYALIQVLDPLTGTWRNYSSSRGEPIQVKSDGVNWRVANLTSCPIGAIVTVGGSNYVQATTTVTASAGGSTWQAVVGGSVATTVSISASGANYGIAPLVFFPAPPSPGVQATAIASIANGTVNGISITNQGAGYTTAPVPVVLPNPADPNLISGTAITNASFVTALANSGKVTAVLCTNSGAPVTTAPTLTVAGAGTTATVSPVMMWTVTGVTVGSGGAGYNAQTALTSVGGIPTVTPAYTNPATEFTGYIPRSLSALLASTGGTIQSVSTLYDGGMFTGTPTLLAIGGAATTAATFTPALGGANATVVLQPCNGT